MPQLAIHPDITLAQTPPAWLYSDPAVYERQLVKVFEPSWQLSEAPLAAIGELAPWTLLRGSLNVPLLWTRESSGAVRCLSNVCTHRGATLVPTRCQATSVRCPYHGRRFALDGRCTAAPGFEEHPTVVGPTDHLPRLPTASWGPLGFASLTPDAEASDPDPIEELRARTAFLPIDQAKLDVAASPEYELAANWALYCENYLEGFHIPYVHRSLAQGLDLDAYAIELWPRGSLQLGIAKEGEPTFDLPKGHPDEGKRVAGYYAWFFPNFMLNIYPWGISANIVLPQGPTQSVVRYLTYVWDPSKRSKGAGADLKRVEEEDQAMVTSVQRGIGSKLYRRGRYSPRHEAAVHHFHLMLALTLEADALDLSGL